MKLLYLASLDFFTKPNPSYHLMTSMIMDVLEAGIGIDYIGIEEEGVNIHIPKDIENHSGFTYDLIKCPAVKKSNFVKRYLEGIRYSFCARRYLKKYIDECDVVFVQSSPTVLYSLIFAKKYAKEKAVIYNVQDMFPGSSIASGVMPKQWMQNIFYKLQRIAYKKSDVITVISEDMKQKVMEQGVDENKIKVIVNWFDDKTVHPVEWEENRFVKKYDMKNDTFYVQYAGTMGYVFDYKIVLEVAEKLKSHKDIIIQMIGEGSQKQAFVEAAKEKKLDNIHFLPLEKQEMVSDVYSACSVCYIPLKKGIIGNSVPSKAGLLMACKKPIITSVDEGSDYYNMINSFAGIAVSDSEPDDVVKAILYMKEKPEMCTSFGIRGYEYGHELYSRSNGMKKYIQLFEECCEQKI